MYPNTDFWWLQPLDGSDPIVTGGRVRSKRSAGGASGVSTEQGDSEVFVKDEKQILEMAKQDLITLLKLEVSESKVMVRAQWIQVATLQS